MATRRTTIGQMRDVVEFLSRDTAISGDYSGEDTYTIELSTRGRVRSMEGSQSRNGIGMYDLERTNTLTVRRNTRTEAIDTENFVRWQDKVYAIKNAEPIGVTSDDPKKRFLRMELTFYVDSVTTTFRDPSPEAS